MSYYDEPEEREERRYRTSVDMGPEYDSEMPIGLYGCIKMRLPGWRAREKEWKDKHRKTQY